MSLIVDGTTGLTLPGSSSGTTVLQAAASASGTLTLPATTDTLVGKTTTDTLTNKTLTAAALGSSTATTQSASDNSTKVATTAYVDAAVTAGSAVPRSYLAGLTLSAAGATATFGIAVGQAANSANATMLTLASAFTKTGAAWVAGTGNGGIDTGAIANSTWYHVYLISTAAGATVDVIFSTNASSPTLPATYTLFRRIGSMKTNASAQWVKFIQDGDYFAWDVAVLDVNDTNPGTASVTKTLASVPTGVNVFARLNVKPTFASSGFPTTLFIRDIATSDQAPSSTAAPLGGDGSVSAGGGAVPGSEHTVRTNTSAQIAYRISASAGGDVVAMAVLGWNDSRGRNA